MRKVEILGYSQKEFAEMFGFSTSAVCQWIALGKIPVVEFVDGVKRIPASFVNEKVSISEGKLIVADNKEEYRKWFKSLQAEEKIKELARLTIA